MSVEHELIAELNISEAGGDIIPSVAIDLIIAQRTAGLTVFMEGIKKLIEAKKLLQAASDKHWLSGIDEIVTAGIGCKKEYELEAIRLRAGRCVDTSIWTRLMSETGMLTFMSSKQVDLWNAQLHSDKCPEVTIDNVLSTFAHLHASRTETFEQGIIEVFRNLSWDYVTNNPCRLGKKIIIENVLSVSNGCSRYVSVRSHAQNWIDDLARPFWLLDNKNVPDYRVAEGSQFRDFINSIRYTLDGVFTCEWFTIRTYWKGSAHITFKRPDLVEKINDIMARRYPGALPSRV